MDSDAGVPDDRVTGGSQDDPLGPEALDFWVGTWDLSWAGGGVGTNRIEQTLDGRVIEESFEGRDADGVLLGRSVSVRDAADGRWRQTWVDSNGSYLDFVGVSVEGRIAFVRRTSIDGADALQRMVWLDVRRDAFRWRWERSRDDGASWETVWEIDYRRANSDGDG